MMTSPTPPLPTETGVDGPFWERARNEELSIQYCECCDRHTFPPRTVCPACFSDLSWVEVSGDGSIYAYGTVYRPNRPVIFDDRVPFVIAVVELEEGPRIVSNVLSEPDDICVGDPVRVTFRKITETVTLPMFKPV